MLGVERIDLYQMHSFMNSAMVELDWLETLHKLRREDKIDRIGVSLRDNEPNEGIDAATFGLVDSFQVIFNMFEQRRRSDIFRLAKNQTTRSSRACL
jgi:aryl-alcohol dehydrogenase-like predicted oxidoreductase